MANADGEAERRGADGEAERRGEDGEVQRRGEAQRRGADGEAQRPEEPPMPWRQPGTAAAIGSFPGTDPREPVRIMAGETPNLPSIPELPGRGPGADMIGRALGLLSEVAPEFAGETTTTGWRLAGRSTDAGTRAMRRARSWLTEDFDSAHEGYQGAAAVKCAMAGPWTVAAAVELPNGHRLLSDPGAIRDLTAASIHAAENLARRLRSAWPAAVVQIDEPALGAVLDAAVPTPSGMDRYRSVPPDTARTALARMVAAVHDAGAAAWLHSCAIPAPIGLLLGTEADGISVDLTAQSPNGDTGQNEQLLGQLLEGSQVTLAAGILSPLAAPDPVATAHRLLRLLDRIGVPLDTVADRIVVTPSCGLAGATPAQALAVMKAAAEVAKILAKESGAAPQSDAVPEEEQR